jgi:hypothetical protein
MDRDEETESSSSSSSPRQIRVGELGKPEQDGVAVVPGQMPQFASGKVQMLFIESAEKFVYSSELLQDLPIC